MELTLTDQNFEEQVLKAKLPVLVDFYTNWCSPCKLMTPTIDEIAKEYEGKLMIGKLDVDANQTTAVKYAVMSIPTIIIFKNGSPVKQLVGYQGKESLIKEINLIV